MAQDNKSTGIALTILLGVFLQVLFGFADSKETPGKVAVEFANAYFMLNPSMSKHLCKELTTEGNKDLVRQYIIQSKKEAIKQGFDANFFRTKIMHVEATTLHKDETTAKIKITGERKRCINSLFTYIGKLFNLGQTYEIDEVISIIKEDGKWKVCNGLLS